MSIRLRGWRDAALTILVGFCLFATPPAFAQMEGGTELFLKEDPDVERGTVAIWRGNVSDDGDMFFIQNMSNMQPASAILMAGDIRKPLTLHVAKYQYDDPVKSVSTGREGYASHEFRTQGEVKFRVESDTPGAEYWLMVWADEEKTPELPPVITSIEDVEKGGGFNWLFLLIVAAVAGGGFFYWIRKGRAQ